jgi:hypothetical protein
MLTQTCLQTHQPSVFIIINFHVQFKIYDWSEKSFFTQAGYQLLDPLSMPRSPLLRPLYFSYVRIMNGNFTIDEKFYCLRLIKNKRQGLTVCLHCFIILLFGLINLSEFK